MQLTQFTDYSLRALIYIAIKQNTCTINDIATAYAISHNHLIKIIHNLSKLGIVKTIRGKNGGIIMAENPAEINFKALVLKLEPHFDLVPLRKKQIVALPQPVNCEKFSLTHKVPFLRFWNNLAWQILFRTKLHSPLTQSYS